MKSTKAAFSYFFQAGDSSNVDDLKAVEELCDAVMADPDRADPNLPFLFWLTLVKSGKDDRNAQRARRLLGKHPAVLDLLEAELDSYAKEYSQLEEKPARALYKSMPAAFALGDIERFTDSLEVALAEADDAHVQSAACYRALCLWNAGHYSRGLAAAAAVLEFLLRNTGDEARRVRVGRTAARTLSPMLAEAAAGDMGPALDFMDLVCQKLSQTFPGCPSLVPYLYWIQLNHCEKTKSKAEQVLARYPGISDLR